MDLSSYSKYLDSLHTDRMSIYRYKEIENEDGSTEEVLNTDPSLENIPCRLSKVKADEHNINMYDANKQNIKFKIFCSIDVEILKGDSLVIKRVIGNQVVDTIKAIAGAPIKYDINQEVIIIEDGEA